MSELIAGIAGAFVGAVAAYGLGWWQKVRDDRRRRIAIATALMIEMYAIADVLRYLRVEWGETKAVLEFPTTIHDDFGIYVEYFTPETASAVLDLLGAVRDIRKGLDTIYQESAVNPDAVRRDVKVLASVALAHAVREKRSLSAEGASTPKPTLIPSPEAIEALMAEVSTPWKHEASLLDGLSN